VASGADILHRLPTPLQDLALSGYGLRLRWLRYGRRHRETLSRLRAIEGGTPEEVTAEQQRVLRATLAHARAHVPFYRDRSTGDEDLTAWPTLTKSEVQHAGDRLVADTHRHKSLTTIFTGGTTGQALAIRCDRAALQANYAFFELFKTWATGDQPVRRVATFAGRTIVPVEQRKPPYWRRNFAARQMLFSSYHLSPDSLEDYVRALERFAPDLIDSYPSSIEPIARHVLDRGGSRLAPRAVITSSETLFPEVRAVIESAFGCRVHDQYGSAEMVAFAAQCEAGRYHPHPLYGVIEILRADGTEAAPGEMGEIVATGFCNGAMPLVRYRMGDLGSRVEEPCPCGRPFPVMTAPMGRMDDVIVTPDGRRVGRIDPIFKGVAGLHEARVVQTSLDLVRLEIVTGDEFEDADAEALKSELGLRLGNEVRIEVARVERIPRTGRGKLRTVVSPFGRRTES